MKIAAAAIALLLLLFLPLLPLPVYYVYLLTIAFVLATLATAWNLLARSGQISFGHAGFFGLGAYAAALSSLAGITPGVSVALGGLIAAVGGGAVGLLSHRLRGVALTLATLAVAELLRGLALNWTSLTGGGGGLLGIPPLRPIPEMGPDASAARIAAYDGALALLLGALALFKVVSRSRVGLSLAALRENEARAMVLGLRPLPWKVLAFALSALGAGFAGGLYAHIIGTLAPEVAFDRFFSIAPVVMATVGGLHTLFGPAIAAGALYLASELVFHRLAPALHQLPYAALLIILVYLPRGPADVRSAARRARRVHGPA